MSIENKYKAAMLLLSLQTDLLAEHFPDQLHHLASEHYDRFLAATKNDSALYEAGMVVVAEQQEMD